MLMKNPSKSRVVCESLRFTCEPGEQVEVADGYCTPRLAVPGTKPQEPAIRLLCPQLVPADESLHADWYANRLVVRAPQPPPPTPLDLEATGLSPGVAALAAAGQAGAAPRPTRPAAPKQR